MACDVRQRLRQYPMDRNDRCVRSVGRKRTLHSDLDPKTSAVSESAAPSAVDDDRKVVGVCHRWHKRRIVGGSEHTNHHPQLFERLLASGVDDLQRLLGLLWIIIDQMSRHPRLHRNHRKPMSHHIVKIPGDPQPFGLDTSGGLTIYTVPEPVAPGADGIGNGNREECNCQLTDELRNEHLIGLGQGDNHRHHGTGGQGNNKGSPSIL